MHKTVTHPVSFPHIMLAASLAFAPAAGFAQGNAAKPAPGKSDYVEFDETKVLIEINATDGDVGFHALLDGDAWRIARIRDPRGHEIFQEKAKQELADQGLTESFFESAEPLCQADPEEPDARVVPLGQFLERFEAGEYTFTAKTLEGEAMLGTAQLTYALPAATEILSFDGSTIIWAPGDALGLCQDDTLVTEGIIEDPATVDIVGWQVVVEPADDEAVDPLRIFSVELPANVRTVTVPQAFMQAYFEDGVTEFKVEIISIEESGNQTASEEEFDLSAG
ncbi:hypothetical protein [Thiohalomonas denitrificans]|uniref:Uncharacterized protein n=1 Tax=Thiohalomonas denitrificans TaxID=415747 RepID=A0A1G5Q870_9GAMM|nr:hypothetical protein [Thiohalomonas denitrificans]SCZ57469.1 hypothetical protein SAMN03097708_01434 [Thiohalomonas denitrificans]